MPGGDVFSVGVVLTPGFSLMAYASLVEPMRGANMVAGRELYRWRNLSSGERIVVAGSGLEVVTAPLPRPTEAFLDMVVVVGGMGSETYHSEKLRSFLRAMLRRNLLVGSLSTASFILASSGILDGKRCTVHWGYVDAFRESFPDLKVTNELYVMDGRVFTCAGGTASMDLMLQVIRQRHGDQLAGCVCDTFVYGAIRQPEESQRLSLRNRLGVADPVIINAVEIMEAAIEKPMKLPDLANLVGVSVRHLERLFCRTMGSAPTQHYIRLRLDRARSLLRHTTMSVSEVGLACGFASGSHFARTYRLQFGKVPSSDRWPAAVPIESTTPKRNAMTAELKSLP